MCIAGLLDALRSTLPAGARIVWMCLENHADQNRKWSMSLERIVAEVNLSIETVVRSVRLLEARGIVRGQRDGPGRKATVWHMLRSYDPSPYNGGMAPEETPQAAGMNGDQYPHNEGIKCPETPQADGIEMRGSPQNAGISNPAKCGDLTHQVSNPPKEPPVGPHGVGTGTPAEPGTPPRRADGTNPRVVGTNPRATGASPRQQRANPRAKGTNPRNGFLAQRFGPSGPIIDATAEELAEFHAFRGNLRIVGATNG